MGEFLEFFSVTFVWEEVVGQEEQVRDFVFAEIGQLKVENDFLKKSCKKLGIEI